MTKTAKPLYKTRGNYTPFKGTVTTEDTKVLPNEAMTVRQMLIRHANGTMFDNVKTPYYEEQAQFSSKPFNVMQQMDETEKLIYLQEVTEEAMALKDKIADHKQKMDAIVKEAKEKAEAQKRKRSESEKAEATSDADKD